MGSVSALICSSLSSPSPSRPQFIPFLYLSLSL